MFTNPDSWISSAITLIIVIFGGGKVFGILDTKQKTTIKRVEELEDSFLDHEGEQRFVTHRQHDKLQSACQGVIMSEFTHIKESIERIEKKLDTRS